jgi:cysteine desulfurase
VKRPIYLDYNATTPVDPRVLEAMLPYFTEVFGNPASKNHTYGNEAFKAVEDARETIAKAIKARPQEIVFTSGATEAINLAIKGVALANCDRGKHLITVATEHSAVLDCFDWLAASGFETTILPVDSEGLLDPAQVAGAIRMDTILVAVMAANNEIGVIQPLKDIGKICHERGLHFMTDATQALGKIPLDVRSLNVDLLAASGHKVYGPKGVGFLYVRRSNPRVSLETIIHGGGHERGLRSGTLATPNIIGLAKAVELAMKEMIKEEKRLGELRDELMRGLLTAIPGARVNGSLNHRLAGNLNITFPGVESEALMIALRSEIAASSGSACTTAAVMPSHVLRAIGLTAAQSHSTIRLGLGRWTSVDDVIASSDLLSREVKRLRQLLMH